MSFNRTSPIDSGRSRPWRVTVEVSTTPSGPPVPASRTATLAAETVPMLVPTSQTGTAASWRRAAITARTSSA
jgi:hypothetical protein